MGMLCLRDHKAPPDEPLQDRWSDKSHRIETAALAKFLHGNRRLAFLDSDQARDLLTATAISDKDTDLTPNYGWGYGKINVRGALDRLCKLYRQPKCLRR